MQKAPLRSINTRRGAFYTIDHAHSHERKTLPSAIMLSTGVRQNAHLLSSRTSVILLKAS